MIKVQLPPAGNNTLPVTFLSSVAQLSKSGLGHFIVGVSRSHTHIHTHTHTHTHKPDRTPLNERSGRRRGRYLQNTQQTQQMNMHAVSRIRTRNPRRPRDALDRAATEIGFSGKLLSNLLLISGVFKSSSQSADIYRKFTNFI
jgi:hypothetical protein